MVHWIKSYGWKTIISNLDISKRGTFCRMHLKVHISKYAIVKKPQRPFLIFVFKIVLKMAVFYGFLTITLDWIGQFSNYHHIYVTIWFQLNVCFDELFIFFENIKLVNSKLKKIQPKNVFFKYTLTLSFEKSVENQDYIWKFFTLLESCLEKPPLQLYWRLHSSISSQKKIILVTKIA